MKTFFLAVLLTLSLVAPSSPPSLVNVILMEGKEIRVGSPSHFYANTIRVSSGEYVLANQNGTVALQNQPLAKEVFIVPGSPLFHLTANGTPYRGSFLVKTAGTGLRLINQIPLEEYLYGVVGKEMPGSDLEALKAQAIASRTLAVHSLLRGRSMRPTISDQVYGGVLAERQTSNQAVDETRGLVLTYERELLTAPLFSSTCGGKTEDNADVFGKPLPYLRSVADADEASRQSYCQASPYFSWNFTWSGEELRKNLEPFKVQGDVVDLSVKEVDENGRVKELEVRTTRGAWKFRGFAIRRILKRPDGKILNSTWFALSKEKTNGSLQFTASGHGQGHGVGLCQWGAIGMAKHGKRFREILRHYYQGTQIEDATETFGASNRGRG